MRELKFRRWNKQHKHMTHFDMHHLLFNYGNATGTIHSALLGAKPEELMQYTGLHDKNGKEIYEGDVLLVEGFDIGVVEYDKSCYRLRSSYYLTNCEDTSESLFEVIGNIHENPELLKRADD